jgi:hypothetical protein
MNGTPRLRRIEAGKAAVWLGVINPDRVVFDHPDAVRPVARFGTMFSGRSTVSERPQEFSK